MSNSFRPALCMKKGSLPLPRRLFFQSGLFVCLHGWLSAGLHTHTREKEKILKKKLKKIVNEFSTKPCKKDGAWAKEETAGRVFTRHICAHNPSVPPCSCCCFCCCVPVFSRRFMQRDMKNIIRPESLLTYVTSTTQPRFTATGKKKKPGV